MMLGAFNIPREDWAVARSLGLTYSFIEHDVWDITTETKIGEYLDDVEPPSRPPRADLESWAQGVSDRGFLPVCSMVPSFLGSIASATRSWGQQQHLWKGYQAYWYSPFLWSAIETWLARKLIGWRLRGTKWFGIVQTVSPVYAPQSQWKPLSPSAIRTQLRQWESAGAEACVFFPFHRDALERVLR